jgi:hypothetical protein
MTLCDQLAPSRAFAESRRPELHLLNTNVAALMNSRGIVPAFRMHILSD